MSTYDTIADVIDALAEYENTADDLPTLDAIKDSLDEIASNYESRIAELECDLDNLQDTCDDLEEKLCNNESHVEAYAASMLKNFTGHEPSLGEVLSLTEEITKILVKKFNISTGNL